MLLLNSLGFSGGIMKLFLNMTQNRTTLIGIGLLAISISRGIILQAATFAVSDVSGIQSALNTAAHNGENDTIEIAAGTYTLSTTLTFVSTENCTLTIHGVSSSQTILDGGLSVQVMNLEATQSASHITISHLGIIRGQTTESGGGLSVLTDSAHITLEYCSLSHNRTTGNAGVGGGAALSSESGTISISDSTVQDNLSHGNVGGLFAGVSTGDIHVSDCTFQSNSVNNTGGSTYFGDGGGAMLYSDPGGATGGSVLVTGNTFENNSASGGDNPDGGGLMVYLLGTGVQAEVRSNTFNTNTAGLGGGGCMVRINGQGSITFSENRLTGNEAVLDAGGGAFLYLNSGSLTCADNTFSGNTSGDSGGGAWVMHDSGSSVFRGNLFFANETGSNGGGANIYLETASSTLEKNQFADNEAGNSGGGLSYSTSSGAMTLNHNTFYDNTAIEGGAIYCYFADNGASTTINNLILWNDHPDEFAYSYDSSTPPVVFLTYCDVSGLASQPWAGTGCINTNPLFADAPGRDFNLTWLNYPTLDTTQSPCIDSGDPVSPLDTDGTRTDMGALSYTQLVAGQPTYTGVFIFCRQDVTSEPVSPYVEDPDPGDTHTFAVITDPLHGRIETTPDDTQLRLVPQTNFTGKESFTYRAIDPLGLSITGTGEILVLSHLFFTNLALWPDPDILYFITCIDNPNRTP
jgi:archaellum component FlaF (FlaF/FlaG flagellin family)